LFDPNTKLWREVSEDHAKEKVSHSLKRESSGNGKEDSQAAQKTIRKERRKLLRE
jgi:hypothetical protein